MIIMEVLKKEGVEIPEEIIPILKLAQRCLDNGSSLDDIINVFDYVIYLKECEKKVEDSYMMCGG